MIRVKPSPWNIAGSVRVAFLVGNVMDFWAFGYGETFILLLKGRAKVANCRKHLPRI